MIDLHCHLLPSIDDGSRSLDESLAMARMAVSDGISVIACTPHILPGVYNNKGPDIRAAVVALQKALDKEGIPLVLTSGADVHIAPDLVDGLKSGRILPLGESRYLLLEPPNMVVPPRFEDHLFNLVCGGYVPIITHPERLKWSESDFGVFARIVHLGAWLQLTAGSLLGQFGRRAEFVSKRLLSDGLVHIIASDAHNTDSRPPLLSDAWRVVAGLIGEEGAFHLVDTRPAGIIDDIGPENMPPPVRPAPSRSSGGRSVLGIWPARE